MSKAAAPSPSLTTFPLPSSKVETPYHAPLDDLAYDTLTTLAEILPVWVREVAAELKRRRVEG